MEPLKLNLGCANDIKDGYINIDKYHKDPRVQVFDVRDISSFKEKNVVEIYASDVIEHFEFQDAVKIIKHWVDVLSSGGKLYIKTICIKTQIESLLKGYWSLQTFNAKLFAGKGWVDGVSRDHDFHKCALDVDFLKSLLQDNDMVIQNVEVDEPYQGRATNLNMSITAIKK